MWGWRRESILYYIEPVLLITIHSLTLGEYSKQTIYGLNSAPFVSVCRVSGLVYSVLSLQLHAAGAWLAIYSFLWLILI